MPRQRTHINVPFGAGSDEKTDVRSLGPGQWSLIRNGQFTKRGSLRQRGGYLAKGKGVNGGGNLGGPIQTLATFRSDLVSVDKDGWLSAYRNNGTWTNISRIAEATAQRTQVGDSAFSQASCDVAANATVVVHVWVANPTGTWPNIKGDVYAKQHDAVTGAPIGPPVLLLATNGLAPRVAIVGSAIAVVMWDASTTTYKAATATAGSNTWSATSALSVGTAADTTDGVNFDWIALSDRFVLAYPPTSDNGVITRSYNTSLTALNTTTVSDARCDSLLAVGLNSDISNNVYLVYWAIDSGGTLTTAAVTKLNSSLTVQHGPDQLPAGMQSGVGLVFLISCVWMTATTLMVIMSSGSTPSNTGVRCQLMNPTTGASVGNTIFTPEFFHISKPFVFGSDAYCLIYRGYTINSGTSSIQGTLFVGGIGTTAGAAQIRPTCTIAPRLASPTTGGIRATSVAGVYSSGNTYTTVASTVTDGQFPSGRLSVVQVDITFRNNGAMLASPNGECLGIATGVPWLYDGLNSFEQGFLVYPEGVTAATAGAGGSITAGTYLYAVVFEYIDAAGQRHQSAPSPSVSVTFGAGTTNKTTLTVPSVQLTSRNAADISVVVYRTLAGGTTFFRVTSDIVPAANRNQLGTATFTIDDTAIDSSISSNPVLYTTGGELPNFCPPSASIVLQHKGRTWLGGTDEGKAVWYSKPVVPGFAPAFHDAFTIYFPDGGRVTGLASLDDKLVVFKADRIFIVYGDGPNSLGTGSDYQVQTVATDEGCVSARSVVTCPLGVMFQGHKGLMLLSRDLQVAYVGAPVEDSAASATITSAVQVPELNQVRFTIGFLTLVFDYFQKQWATWEIYDDDAGGLAGATAAVEWNGLYHWAGSSGMAYAENSSLAYDGSTSHLVVMSAQSAWIRSSSFAGFQRVSRVSLLCDSLNNCNVTFAVATDYDTSVSNVASFTPVSGSLSQFELVPIVGKCESMRFTVTTSPSVGASLATFIGIDVELQLDTRTFKGLRQSLRR